jgi:hypothetical protein
MAVGYETLEKKSKKRFGITADTAAMLQSRKRPVGKKDNLLFHEFPDLTQRHAKTRISE